MSLPDFSSSVIYSNLLAEELIEHTIQKKQGVLSDTGALVIDTGKFTGRVPKDRYFVKDAITENKIFWGEVNHPVSQEVYEKLHAKMKKLIGIIMQIKLYNKLMA
mgnify:CR=1 FL=1